MKVAAIQFEPRLGERAHNVERLLHLLDEAFCAGARIAVAPEMATSGYCIFDTAEADPLAETIPGPATLAVAELCQAHGGVAVFGLPEVDEATGIFFNSIAVVGPAGLLGRYRKLHSFISEPRWAMDGNLGPQVVQTPHGAIGVLDCADIMYPELARSLQILGADLIAFPTNWCSDPAPSPVWWATAWELGLPLVAADRTGLERGVLFAGGSAIFDGDGHLVAARDQGEGILLGDVGPRQETPRNAPIPRQEATALARSTYLFDPHAFFRLYGREDLPLGGRLDVQVRPLRGSWPEVSERLGACEGDIVVLPADALWTEGPGGEELLHAMAEWCRAQGRFLAAGVLDADGHQALWLVGPEGVILDHQPGEGAPLKPPAASLLGARVALCSGAELARPEVSRLAAVGGADLLLVLDQSSVPAPIAFPGSDVRYGGAPAPADSNHYYLPRVRAITDDLYIAYASADLPCGFFEAESGVGVVSRAGAGGTVDTRLTGSEPPKVRQKPLLQRRRPEHYWALWSPVGETAAARNDGRRGRNAYTGARDRGDARPRPRLGPGHGEAPARPRR